MAVMNTNTSTNTTTKGGGTTAEYDALVKVDLNDKSIPDGETQEVDQAADAYDRPETVPIGKWRLKLFADAEGAKMGTREPGNAKTAFYTLGLECKVLQGLGPKWKDYEDSIVYSGVSTRIGRNKKVSTMQTILVKLGYGKNLKATMSDKDLAVLFNKVLRLKEPACWCELEWKGYSASANKTVYYHAKDFGVDKNGQPNSSVQFRNKDGLLETITARPYVVRWYSDAEAQGFLTAKATAPAGPATGKPAAAPAPAKPKAKPAPVEEEVEVSGLDQAEMFADMEPGGAAPAEVDTLDDDIPF